MDRKDLDSKRRGSGKENQSEYIGWKMSIYNQRKIKLRKKEAQIGRAHV